jgi:hypothetical protein
MLVVVGGGGDCGKGKGKVYPRTGQAVKDQKRYSSTLSLTSALDGSG